MQREWRWWDEGLLLHLHRRRRDRRRHEGREIVRSGAGRSRLGEFVEVNFQDSTVVIVSVEALNTERQRKCNARNSPVEHRYSSLRRFCRFE